MPENVKSGGIWMKNIESTYIYMHEFYSFRSCVIMYFYFKFVFQTCISNSLVSLVLQYIFSTVSTPFPLIFWGAFLILNLKLYKWCQRGYNLSPQEWRSCLFAIFFSFFCLFARLHRSQKLFKKASKTFLTRFPNE